MNSRKATCFVIFLLLAAFVLLGNRAYADTLIFQAGIDDNFAHPTETPSPSSYLTANLAFDDIPGVTPGVQTTVVFGHTFTNLPPGGITGATLELHVQAGDENTFERTDLISLSFADASGANIEWLRYFGTPNRVGIYGSDDDGLFPYPWLVGSDETFTLDLAALPIASQQGGGFINLLPMLNEHRFLDVSVHDETGVDYLTLSVTAPPQQIFLDWDTPISRYFYVKNTGEKGPDTNKQMWGNQPGTMATVTATAAYKEEVRVALQAILDRSGLAIPIVNEPSTDAVAVQFGAIIEADLEGNSEPYRLWGRALSSSLRGEFDQFNEHTGGEVAIFIDPKSNLLEFDYDLAKEVAKTIAHEVGHEFGLRHVNAPEEEAMHYPHAHSPEVELPNTEFTNAMYPISDNLPFNVDQNPLYHLRAYVLGESRASLEAAGVMPGLWDLVPQPEPVRGSFNTLNYASILHNVVVQADFGDGWATIAHFDQIDPNDPAALFFAVTAGATLRILASSQSGGDLDLLFGSGDPAEPIFEFPDTTASAFVGQIYTYSSEMDSYTVIGSFEGVVVPEPVGLITALLGIVSALAFCRFRTRFLTGGLS